MARNLLFRSRADALLVAVKGHFLCRARWGYSREQDKRPLFGQQQGQERWHLGIGLGGWFQICLRVWSRHGAGEDGHIPAVFREVTLSRPVLARCWCQNFLQGRLSERYLWNFLRLIPLSWRAHMLRDCVLSIDFLRRKLKQGLSGYIGRGSRDYLY